MIPGLSEKINLQRVYDRIAIAIRSVDPSRNIGFEPVTWLQSLKSGFSHPPGGMRFAEKSIFCYHFYTQNILNKYKFTNENYLEARHNDSLRLGTGGILTEFFITSEKGS